MLARVVDVGTRFLVQRVASRRSRPKSRHSSSKCMWAEALARVGMNQVKLCPSCQACGSETPLPSRSSCVEGTQKKLETEGMASSAEPPAAKSEKPEWGW